MLKKKKTLKKQLHKKCKYERDSLTSAHNKNPWWVDLLLKSISYNENKKTEVW